VGLRGRRSLIVEHGRADGELKETKTGKIRTVGLLAPVSEDLAAWRMSPSGSAGLVFPRPDGEVFRDTDYRNWRKRHFDPVAAAVEASHGTPYTLRHSFASLLVQAGGIRSRSLSRWATRPRSFSGTTRTSSASSRGASG